MVSSEKDVEEHIRKLREKLEKTEKAVLILSEHYGYDLKSCVELAQIILLGKPFYILAKESIRISESLRKLALGVETFTNTDDIERAAKAIALREKKGSKVVTSAHYYQHPIKCFHCGLHYIVCSDYRDWPRRVQNDKIEPVDEPIYCPECGLPGTKTVYTPNVVEGYIFQAVPGEQGLRRVV